MLTAEEMQEVIDQVALGQSAPDERPELRRFRTTITREIAEMQEEAKERGLKTFVDYTPEFPDLP